MRYAFFAIVACLVVGWFVGLIPSASTVQKLKSASKLDPRNAVHKGMKEDAVIQALGAPDKRINDPASGLVMWAYNGDNGSVLISFNVDEVVDVRSTGL